MVEIYCFCDESGKMWVINELVDLPIRGNYFMNILCYYIHCEYYIAA